MTRKSYTSRSSVITKFTAYDLTVNRLSSPGLLNLDWLRTDERVEEELYELISDDTLSIDQLNKLIEKAVFLCEVLRYKIKPHFVLIDASKEITPLMITGLKALGMVPIFFITKECESEEDEDELQLEVTKVVYANHPDPSHPSNTLVNTDTIVLM